ncbi:MAG TPA: YqhA family protein [Nautiliaceae bacterium]|nr:YqhA family protein [Nautiliaceae bacterium]
MSIKRLFEKFLWNSRLLVLVAVVSSIFSSFSLFFLGVFEIFKGITFFLEKESYSIAKTKLVTYIINAVDIFLIATVLLIFSLGLYELFIGRIEEIEKEKGSKILQIHSLDELKEKIAKVIIMVLIVVFFKHAMEISYSNLKDLIYLSLTILLITLSYFLLNKAETKQKRLF